MSCCSVTKQPCSFGPTSEIIRHLLRTLKVAYWVECEEREIPISQRNGIKDSTDPSLLPVLSGSASVLLSC